MSFKEITVWVNGLVTLVVGAVYFGVVGARVDGGVVE